ncbi:hypothetical protein [Acidiphilium acidophilum]|nr:hypothetical protein [Acidiphilium acidophilum]
MIAITGMDDRNQTESMIAIKRNAQTSVRRLISPLRRSMGFVE